MEVIMPCRVGITTRPEERRNEWEREVVGFRDWNIIARLPTKEEAQNFEDRYAKNHNCEASGGGEEAPGPWYVYVFGFDWEK